MDKIEQNITIAEICGWKWTRGCLIPWDELLIWNKPWEPTQDTCGFTIPDYLDDPRESVEIETYVHTYGRHCQDAYVDSLTGVVERSNSNANPTFALASAQPREKAEAFLRMHGKWKEGK